MARTKGLCASNILAWAPHFERALPMCMEQRAARECTCTHKYSGAWTLKCWQRARAARKSRRQRYLAIARTLNLQPLSSAQNASGCYKININTQTDRNQTQLHALTMMASHKQTREELAVVSASAICMRKLFILPAQRDAFCSCKFSSTHTTFAWRVSDASAFNDKK